MQCICACECVCLCAWWDGGGGWVLWVSEFSVFLTSEAENVCLLLCMSSVCIVHIVFHSSSVWIESFCIFLLVLL